MKTARLVALMTVVATMAILMLAGSKTQNSYVPRCAYQWDSGLVCPMTETTGEYTIRPLADCTEEMRDLVGNHMLSEWGYGLEYMQRTWSMSGDTYYVMTGPSGEFMGTVAVDRKHMYPFISQLYVRKKHRRKGHATTLLAFAEKYGKSMGFDSTRLWCDASMSPYYAARGYAIENRATHTGKNVLVMVKRV
jgi:GNAT superfamily N-acetyltransferase